MSDKLAHYDFINNREVKEKIEKRYLEYLQGRSKGEEEGESEEEEREFTEEEKRETERKKSIEERKELPTVTLPESE